MASRSHSTRLLGGRRTLPLGVAHHQQPSGTGFADADKPLSQHGVIYHLRMGMRGRDVLAGRTRVLVDGSNQRGPGSEPLPDEPYARSLRALFPPSIEVVVVFDTDPPIGSGTVRGLGGVTIVHARAGGGDDAIVQRAAAEPNQTLVVTNDIGLRDRVTLLGARAERNDWLRDRIQRGRQRAPSIGQRLVRRTDATSDEEADGATDRAWHPGRGATAKRGPRKKPPRHR